MTPDMPPCRGLAGTEYSVSVDATAITLEVRRGGQTLTDCLTPEQAMQLGCQILARSLEVESTEGGSASPPSRGHLRLVR